jgi:4-amino-4-deoxy-L-arabinose transferase-like glycosyltransferase
MALFALIGGHFCMLMMYFEPAIGTPDASGYYVQTRLIATEGRTWFERESPLQYVNHHWLSPGGDRYFSQYPPGLSAISAVVFRIAGPTAALLVNPVLSSLTLLGLFLLCRSWIGAGWGLVAATVMAVNPIANEHALSCDSHTAVAFLLVWGLYLLALWSRKQSPFLAFSAGAVLGIIPTIRYPEALFLLAAALFMLLHFSRDHKPWRSLPAAAVGALIPISCLLVHNHFAFGSFWKTGYALTNEQAAFAWEHLVRKALPYVAGIMGEGTGLLAAIGLVAMTALCVRRATRREGLLLLALVVPVTVLYMAYALPEASIRFLIPTFSIYILAAVWGLKLLADRRPRVAATLVAVMIVATACWGIPRSISSLRRLERENSALAAVTRIVTEHAAPGSVVIADPRIQQQLDYIGRWKLVDESILTGEDPESGGPPPGEDRRPRGESRPPRDGTGGPRAVHERERRQILDRYTDRQGPVLSGRILEDLDAWRGNGKVYWLGDLTLVRRLLPQSDQLQVLARIRVASPERRPPPPPGPRPPRASPPPPRDQERREDAARMEPDQRPDDRELVLMEWTRPAASR